MAVSAQLGVSLNGAVDGHERHRQERCAISSPRRLGTRAPQRDHDYEVDIENFPIGRGAMLRELEEDPHPLLARLRAAARVVASRAGRVAGHAVRLSSAGDARFHRLHCR
jgi:hypothetical protein